MSVVGRRKQKYTLKRVQYEKKVLAEIAPFILIQGTRLYTLVCIQSAFAILRATTT